MRIGTLALIALTLAGCTAFNGQAPVSTPSTATLSIPTITPQAETEAKYKRPNGDLKISVEPVAYTASIKEHKRVQPINPPMGVMLVRSAGDDVYAAQTISQTATVEPAQLRFLVKINNQMARVFYGKGTVVQFNCGGRLLAVDQSGYSTFLGAIVPPRQEQQIEIIGPPLSSLPKPNGIIGLFLYDVVTQQDDAGKVTEKQNYEWYFDYKMEDKTVELSSMRTEGFISMAAYQENMRREQMQQMQQNQGRYPQMYTPPQGQ